VGELVRKRRDRPLRARPREGTKAGVQRKVTKNGMASDSAGSINSRDTEFKKMDKTGVSGSRGLGGSGREVRGL